VEDQDYLTLFGLAFVLVLGARFHHWARLTMRWEGRRQSLLLWAATAAMYCGAVWVTGDFVDRVGRDVHEEPGVFLEYVSSSRRTWSKFGGSGFSRSSYYVFGVSHGTFISGELYGPCLVRYRVGRFTGRVHPISVTAGETTGR
jgi:hypothetical protein